MRSCLVYLGIFLALGAAGAAALTLTVLSVHPEGELLGIAQMSGLTALGASLFLVIAIVSIRDARQRLGDRARLAPTTLTLPLDGARTAAAGTLVADGPLLESPFTGTPCAAYRYEVRCTTKGKSHSDVLVAWGYSLTPSHIQAPWGIARLLTLAEIEEQPAKLEPGPIRERVRAYFASTPLVPTGAGAQNFGFDAVKQLHADHDGSIRGDFGPLPDGYLDEDFRYYEKILPDREPVTAIGTWDARLGGLKAQQGREILGSVVVRKGPPETTQRILLKQAIASTIAALVLLAIAGTIVAVFLRVFEVFGA